LGSLQRECLDHFLIWSKRQLYRVVREYISYLNRARRHQGLKQQIPENIPREDTAPASNKIILFPELKEKDREGRRSTAPAAEAHRRGGAGEDHCIPGVQLVPSWLSGRGAKEENVQKLTWMTIGTSTVLFDAEAIKHNDYPIDAAPLKRVNPLLVPVSPRGEACLRTWLV
jgi:hypothetical protein